MNALLTNVGTRLIASLLLVTIFAAPLSLSFPQKAEAATAATGVLVTDIAVGLSTADIAATETEESFVEQVLKGIAWAAAKAVVNSITQSIVNWINSGFQGSPAFATDLNRNLLDLQDAVTNAFLADLFTNVGKGDMINSEFAERIGQTIATSYYIYTSGERLAYRLRSNIQNYSQNPDLFRQGNFSQGGWQAWHQSNVVCGNNVYCFQFAARDEHAVRLMSEVDQRVTELEWGRGFLSWRGDCDKYAGGTQTNPETGEATPLGTSATETACLHHKILTPGSTIEDYLVEQLSSGIRQLELADSINEIVGALVGQLVQRVFGQGGLLGTSDSPSGGGRSFISQLGDSSGSAAPGSLVELKARVSAQISDVSAFLAGWQIIQGAALATQAALANCNDEASEASLTTVVEPALARANANITRANVALAELNRIDGTLNAPTTPSTNQTALVTQASTDLLALTTSSNMPTAAEVAEARSESSSNADLGESLFLQLQSIATAGCS